MQKPSFDPGLTQQYTGAYSRTINDDGSFNVRRRGSNWRDVHPYLFLVNISWSKFIALIVLAYTLVNLLFAGIYFSLGSEELEGITQRAGGERFLQMFYFSSHTLSTVGYGNISPKGNAANLVACFEALAGVLGLAVATGVMFGRVSRPSAKIGFSDHVLVSPYQDGMSLQFRLVNRRRNNIMDLEARVMLMVVEDVNGVPKRNFEILKLERQTVLFLPLTWTVVHPIDAESPLNGKTLEDLRRMQAEVLVMIKAFDDTFSQTVYSYYSYRNDQFVWNKKFAPAFRVDESGNLELDLQKVGEWG
jgi:inward rectifier potassium channel